MISLRYFMVIMLLGAQFGSILTQETTDAAAAEETTAAAAEETTVAAAEETTAAAGEETTAAAGEETTAAAGEETTAAAGEDTTTASTKAPTKAPTKPPPKPSPVKCRSCYKNSNGICRTFDIDCKKKALNVKDKNSIIWSLSTNADCSKVANEAKVCATDCRKFKTANCPTGKPVCGYSEKRKMCRKYPSICHLKKNACNNPNIGDWRIAKMIRCNGLKLGAPAVRC